MKLINKILYQEIKPYRWKLFGVLLLMLLIVGMEALNPWPFKFLIDNVLGDQAADPASAMGKFLQTFNSRELLGFFVVFVYFLTSLILSILDYFKAISVKKVIKNIMFQFSKTAFANLEGLSIGFYKHREIGDYIYRLSYDVTALGELLEEGILPLIISSLYLMTTATVMFFIDVKLTLLAFAALPFLALGLYFFNQRIVSTTKRSEFWNSAVFSFIQQALSQLKIIQAFSQEKRESQEFTQKMETSLQTDLKVFRLGFLLSLLVGVIIAISYSLIISYGVIAVFRGELSTGLLVVFIFYLDNLTNPLLEIIYATSAIKQNYVKVQRMEEFFTKTHHSVDQGPLTKIIDTTIRFEKVTLASVEGSTILDNVSFTIPHGKMTCIVGVSGSGKTSIISLIPRLIDEPSSGKILIGGKSIKEYPIDVLRQAISLVPQEPILFNDSIKNIISFGNPQASEEEIEHAVKLAVADEFIGNMPGKYNFKVGDEGNYLSGGQRQRLMIARALLKKAEIRIFDEPLSQLDIKTKGEVFRNIMRATKNETTIIVTNVLDIISKSDHVIVVNKGKVVDSGLHDELLKKSNLYKIILSSD